MDDFNLWDLFNEPNLPEEVVQAHELMDSEREPHVEEYDTSPLIGRTFTSPFAREGGWFGSC